MTAPTRRRAVAVAAATLFAALLSPFLAGEVLWRTLDGLGDRHAAPLAFVNVPGDLEPHLDVMDRGIPGLPYRVRTDNQGFRGTGRLSEKKPPGRVRILCLGDSYTFGAGVSDDLTYPALLERCLRDRFPGRDIEVVNAGTPFYDLFDEIAWYREKGARLDPDAILLQFSVSDLEGMAGRFFRENLHHPRGLVYNPLEGRLKLPEMAEAIHHLSERLLGPGAFNPYHSGGPPAAKPPSPDAAFLLAPTETERRVLTDRAALIDERNAPVLARFWDNYKKALAAFDRELKCRGIPLFFLVFPDLYQMREYANMADSALVPFLTGEGIPHLALTQLFRRGFGEKAEELFLTPLYDHLSVKGNTFVAATACQSLDISDKGGATRVVINQPERFFDYAGALRTLLAVTGSGLAPLDPAGQVRVTLERADNLETIEEEVGGVIIGSLAAGPIADRPGVARLRLEAPFPIRRLAVVAFARLFHPAGGGLSLSWSSDGRTFKELFHYVNDPGRTPDAFETMRLAEADLSGPPSTSLWLEIELSGLARLFTEGKTTPWRRFEVILYPARTGAAPAEPQEPS